MKHENKPGNKREEHREFNHTTRSYFAPIFVLLMKSCFVRPAPHYISLINKKIRQNRNEMALFPFCAWLSFYFFACFVLSSFFIHYKQAKYERKKATKEQRRVLWEEIEA